MLNVQQLGAVISCLNGAIHTRDSQLKIFTPEGKEVVGQQ